MVDSAFMYLDKILDENEPVYVRNISKQRGIIVVTLSDGKNTHRETIPNVRAPICLSNKVTPNMLRNSPSLRQLLDAKILELVDRASAEDELKDPEVVESVRAAYERIGYKNPEIARLRDISEDETAVARPEAISKRAGVEEQFANEYSDVIEDAEPDVDLPDVQVRVQALVDSLLSRDMKSRQVKTELSSMDLTAADLTYIIDNTTGIVQKYAKEKFAKLDTTDGYVETP